MNSGAPARDLAIEPQGPDAAQAKAASRPVVHDLQPRQYRRPTSGTPLSVCSSPRMNGHTVSSVERFVCCSCGSSSGSCSSRPSAAACRCGILLLWGLTPTLSEQPCLHPLPAGGSSCGCPQVQPTHASRTGEGQRSCPERGAPKHHCRRCSLPTKRWRGDSQVMRFCFSES